MAKQKAEAKAETKVEVEITEKAANKIIELAKNDKKEGYGLKLYVVPGGCAGFQYGMDFEEKAAKTDIETKQHGLKLFIDKESLSFLKGAKIDYIESLQGSGFKIDNPNVKHSCHCGKSVC